MAANPVSLQRRGQRAPAVREDGIKLSSDESQNFTRNRQNRTQAIGYIIRRQLVEQAKDVLWVEAQFTIRDGAEVECVEIPNPNIATKEDGVCSVQIDHLKNESADVVCVGAAEPTWSTGGVDGDVLRVREHDVAVYIGVTGAVECADVNEGGRASGTMGGQKFVDEGCSAVE